MGNAYILIDDFEKAVKAFTECSSFAQKIHDQHIEGIALFNLALALDETGQRQDAIVQANQALIILDEIEYENIDQIRKAVEKLKA